MATLLDKLYGEGTLELADFVPPEPAQDIYLWVGKEVLVDVEGKPCYGRITAFTSTETGLGVEVIYWTGATWVLVSATVNDLLDTNDEATASTTIAS